MKQIEQAIEALKISINEIEMPLHGLGNAFTMRSTHYQREAISALRQIKEVDVKIFSDRNNKDNFTDYAVDNFGSISMRSIHIVNKYLKHLTSNGYKIVKVSDG